MKEEKKQFRVSLNEDAMDYIEEIKREQNIGFNGDAVAFLIKDHQRLRREQWSLNHISKSVMTILTDSINQNIREELKRVRLGTNNTDRNTQILIELFNGLIYHQDIPDIITTEDIKMAAIKTAENIVQERIENKRQRKIDWEEKYQKKEGAIT
ncbi:hypothetical protein [Bacillus sp. UNCCL81]|uniref:hypothetical protein n=1 Tax=Bacillus sp. UNCCL81 TaxID=1502755 RepID=UPI0008E4C54F|nr:hypothetical protein [Bacillus sp. UNCCL81]SFD59782.1 hypothetical protein SAMN02799633_04219 [Bacillus sp. UNCCL81]